MERIFGILKARFATLQYQLPFPYLTQVEVVIAYCILHNCIYFYDKNDEVQGFEGEKLLET